MKRNLCIPKSYIFGNVHASNTDEYLLFKAIDDLHEKPITISSNDIDIENTIIFSSKEFEECCAINKTQQEKLQFPNAAYRKSFHELIGYDMIPPWNLCMPASLFKEELKIFVTNLKLEIQQMELNSVFEYYKNTYSKHTVIFESLQPIRTSLQSILKYPRSHPNGVAATLVAFYPQDVLNGLAAPCQYLRNETVTGRLKIKDGSPNILTIQKDIRNDIIESRFGNQGSIYYLDFKSLEPRVLLSIYSTIISSTNICLYKVPLDTSNDIYKAIMEYLNIDNITRDMVKLVILMIMYGAKESAIIDKLKEQSGSISYEVATKLHDFVYELFGIKHVKREYIDYEDRIDRNILKNFYGRPMFVEGIEDYKLINYLVQSTAVDVALHGFANIVRKLIATKTIDKIVPIFVLHDALGVDVHNDYEYAIPKLCEYAGRKGNIPGFPNQSFPIEFTKIK